MKFFALIAMVAAQSSEEESGSGSGSCSEGAASDCDP